MKKISIAALTLFICLLAVAGCHKMTSRPIDPGTLTLPGGSRILICIAEQDILPTN
jgi:hypothetical protein